MISVDFLIQLAELIGLLIVLLVLWAFFCKAWFKFIDWLFDND